MDEIYEVMKERIQSKDCTPLDRYNIQMFVGINALGKERFKKHVQEQIKAIEEEKNDE